MKIHTLIAAAVLSVFASAAVAQENATPSPIPNRDAQGPGEVMMQNGQMTGQGRMDAKAPDQQAAENRGIIGLVLALDVDAVGAPAHLSIHRVEPYSPAYYAGIASGDQIAAVDAQSLDGKSLSDIAKLIRGDVGTTVKISLNHRGQSREITLTRVEPLPERSDRGRRMMGMRGGMMNDGGRDARGMRRGMMGDSERSGVGDQHDGRSGMMDHMGGMGR